MLGPLFIDIEGTELSAEDREVLQHPLVGGVIYFTRNFESAEQISQLTAEIKSLRTPELLIAVDHEGGRVQRFRYDFTVLPAVNSIGHAFDKDTAAGLDYALQHGWLMAAELRAVGIDFSFAPVLDLDYGRSAVIGDRALHHDPETVAQLAQQYIKGMNAAGMQATGKHFPGHGWAFEDSHVTIPNDERDFASIMQRDAVPYRRLLQHGLSAVMPAHVIYSEVDSLPACFSAKWLQQVLRHEIGFTGLIISDDLSMEGASIVAAAVPDRAMAALTAGCDMVLICNNRAAAIETIENLKYVVTASSQPRIESLRGVTINGLADLANHADWQHARQVIAQFSNKQQ